MRQQDILSPPLSHLEHSLVKKRKESPSAESQPALKREPCMFQKGTAETRAHKMAGMIRSRAEKEMDLPLKMSGMQRREGEMPRRCSYPLALAVTQPWSMERRSREGPFLPSLF